MCGAETNDTVLLHETALERKLENVTAIMKVRSVTWKKQQHVNDKIFIQMHIAKHELKTTFTMTDSAAHMQFIDKDMENTKVTGTINAMPGEAPPFAYLLLYHITTGIASSPMRSQRSTTSCRCTRRAPSTRRAPTTSRTCVSGLFVAMGASSAPAPHPSPWRSSAAAAGTHERSEPRASMLGVWIGKGVGWQPKPRPC